MQVLYDCDDEHPGLGQAIRPEFFQDFALRANEIDEWSRREKELQEKNSKKKAMESSRQLGQITITQYFSPTPTPKAE